jgi:LCP family protein required for cell wall assembly
MRCALVNPYDRSSMRSPDRDPRQGPRRGATYGSASPAPRSGGNTYGNGGRRPEPRTPQGRSRPGSRPGRPDSRPGQPRGPKSKRRRSPLWTKLVITLGVLIVFASTGTMVGVSTILGQVNSAIQTQNLLGDQAATGTSINGVINILLVGVDTRPGNTIGSRSDSIIIAHIPASHDRMYLVSIPRDTDIPIPGHGSNKINSAFYFGSSNGGGYAGGFQLLAKTLKTNFGLSFNAGAIVNFDGFESIVNALGGVNMYVDEKTTSLHHGYETAHPSVKKAPFSTTNKGLTWHAVPGVSPVIYKVGMQHLTPYEALDYVRIRDFLPNGDYDRERHQQQFIKALLSNAYQQGLSDPLKLNTFVKSISKAFVFDNGGHAISDWIFTLKGLNPSAILTIKTNNGTFNTQVVNGSDQEVLDPTSLQLLQDVKTDTVEQFVEAHPTWLTTN